jgi:DNA-binding winged helix-turn-helix (wHTH) protein
VRVQFEEFTLDSETRQLMRGGRDIHLSPKAFDLLRTLVDQRPRVVDKAELHARIWPGTFVVDANLNVLIAEIRQALADRPRSPRFVRTVHRVGYAFCGEIVHLDRSQPELPGADGDRFWLVWNDRAIVLTAGDNIIGRDPQCHVWLDASGVSRRHACLRIAGQSDEVFLEDLGSKNGTFLEGSRLTTHKGLADGDVIRIGSVELTFRTWSARNASETDRIQVRRRQAPQRHRRKNEQVS